jgi:hypothetical protein
MFRTQAILDKQRDISYTCILRPKELTEVVMQTFISWDTTPCSRKQLYLLPASRWFLASGFFYPEDGGDTFLRNVCSHKIYKVPHPRIRHSSEKLNIDM